MKKFIVSNKSTIKDCLSKMNRNRKSFLIVLDSNKKVLGTFTMGDFRHALYNGAKFNSYITKYYNKNPKILIKNKNSDNLAKNFFLNNNNLVLPLISNNKKLVELIFREDVFLSTKKKYPRLSIPLVIMAGGKGTRLKPFSDILPKALIPLNKKTVLENIIEKFISYGINKIFVITNHKSDIIKSYFKEKKINAKIQFIKEKKELGTAGGLYLLKTKIKGNFFLTNCDVLHDFNYNDFIKFHEINNFSISLIGSLKTYSLPYGICKLDKKGILRELNEKPNYDITINTGLYLLNKNILKIIPKNKFFLVTDMIKKAKSLKKKVGVFPINDSEWHDVGQWNEFQKARNFLGE
tara:strand:- start:7748 stop:8800 length:1053 start_codon:yes stop_codon:yes gene_type:complete